MRKMNCRRYQKLFSAYLDGYLSVRKRLRLQDHLEECEHCAEEFARVREVVALTNGLPKIQPSPDFDRVLQTKLSDSKSATGFSLLFGRRAIAVFGAVCLLLIGTSSVYLYRIRRGSYESRDRRIYEIAPVAQDYTGEDVLTRFVMPNVPAARTGSSELGDIATTTTKDWHEEPRTYILPSITGDRTAQSELNRNYVIKRVSTINTSDEIGL
jgi:hypothetical protein